MSICRGNLRNWCHESTNLADVDTESIRHLKQTLLQESSGTVSDHTITFHFSESETTITSTTLDRLSGHDLNWTTSTSVNLVVHHVTKTLVVGRSEEHLSTELSSSVTVVHDLETS